MPKNSVQKAASSLRLGAISRHVAQPLDTYHQKIPAIVDFIIAAGKKRDKNTAYQMTSTESAKASSLP